MATPTLTKLRYRGGMRVAVMNAPTGFAVELRRAKVTPQRLVGALDLIQAFYTRRAQLERDLLSLAKHSHDKTIVWLCYPKAGGLETDLSRDVIRSIAERAAWSTVGIVSIDATWSALRVKRSAA